MNYLEHLLVNGIKPGIPIDIVDWQGIEYVYPLDMEGKVFVVLWHPVDPENHSVSYEIRYGTNSDPYNNTEFIGRSSSAPLGISVVNGYQMNYFNVQCVMTPPSGYPANERNQNVESYQVNIPVTYDSWEGIKTARYIEMLPDRFQFHITWDPVAKIDPSDVIVYRIYLNDTELDKVTNTLFYQTGLYEGGKTYTFKVRCTLIHYGQFLYNNNNLEKSCAPIAYVPSQHG